MQPYSEQLLPGPQAQPHSQSHQAPNWLHACISHRGMGEKAPGIRTGTATAPRTWCQELGQARGGSSSALAERLQHFSVQGGGGVQGDPGGPDVGLPALKSTSTQIFLGCFHGQQGGVCQEEGKSSQLEIRRRPNLCPLGQGQGPKGLAHPSGTLLCWAPSHTLGMASQPAREWGQALLRTWLVVAKGQTTAWREAA